MIPTYDQMGDMLEEIAAEFPDAFFEGLDGGIHLQGVFQILTRNVDGDELTLGTYTKRRGIKYIGYAFAASFIGGIIGLSSTHNLTKKQSLFCAKSRK